MNTTIGCGWHTFLPEFPTAWPFNQLFKPFKRDRERWCFPWSFFLQVPDARLEFPAKRKWNTHSILAYCTGEKPNGLPQKKNSLIWDICGNIHFLFLISERFQNPLRLISFHNTFQGSQPILSRDTCLIMKTWYDRPNVIDNSSSSSFEYHCFLMFYATISSLKTLAGFACHVVASQKIWMASRKKKWRLINNCVHDIKGQLGLFHPQPFCHPLLLSISTTVTLIRLENREPQAEKRHHLRCSSSPRSFKQTPLCHCVWESYSGGIPRKLISKGSFSSGNSLCYVEGRIKVENIAVLKLTATSKATRSRTKHGQSLNIICLIFWFPPWPLD